MKNTARYPRDVESWRDAIREASALENMRAESGLIQQITLGADELEFTLTGGETFCVPSSADRWLIAAEASRALGHPVEANPSPEWYPPSQTVNYWWAEMLYNFGLLAPEGIVMNPNVVFVRVWRNGPVGKIEAYDNGSQAIAAFDLRDDHPPVDTVTDTLEALRAARKNGTASG